MDLVPIAAGQYFRLVFFPLVLVFLLEVHQGVLHSREGDAVTDDGPGVVVSKVESLTDLAPTQPFFLTELILGEKRQSFENVT